MFGPTTSKLRRLALSPRFENLLALFAQWRGDPDQSAVPLAHAADLWALEVTMLTSLTMPGTVEQQLVLTSLVKSSRRFEEAVSAVAGGDSTAVTTMSVEFDRMNLALQEVRDAVRAKLPPEHPLS